MFAASTTGLAKVAYLNCPTVPPLIGIDTEPPGTSCPSLTFTSFTVCVPLLPETMIRPSSVTVTGLAPAVTWNPTQPL